MKTNKSIDKIWEEIHSSYVWGGYPAEHVIRFVARNYYQKNRKDIKILDFGCGGGAHTWYLAREGFDVYAFDGSKSAVANAKAKLEAENLVAHFSVVDGIDIKYENDYFDAVIDNVCIYANIMDNIIRMYHHIFRILKKGGKLLTVCFGKETHGFGTGYEIEKDTYTEIPDGPLCNRGTVHFYDEDGIRNILKSIGFLIVSFDTIKYTDNGMFVQQYVVQAVK